MIKGNVDAKIMFFEHQDSNVVTTISNSFKRMPELQIEDATSSFGIELWMLWINEEVFNLVVSN